VFSFIDPEEETQFLMKLNSVAVPDPDFYPSRIPEPKTVTKEWGGKIF
jgi:hypothetical protein